MEGAGELPHRDIFTETWAPLCNAAPSKDDIRFVRMHRQHRTRDRPKRLDVIGYLGGANVTVDDIDDFRVR